MANVIRITLVNGEKRHLAFPETIQSDGREQIHQELERASGNDGWIWTKEKRLIQRSAIIECEVVEEDFTGGARAASFS